MSEAEEGCLSLPGLYGQVKRPERVVLNAYNLQGEELTLELDGLFARAAQHEVDHLDGILFTDRLTPTGLADARLGAGGFRRASSSASASGAKFPTTPRLPRGWPSWKNCGREKRGAIARSAAGVLPKACALQAVLLEQPIERAAGQLGFHWPRCGRPLRGG